MSLLSLTLAMSMGLLLEQPVPESLQRTVRTFDFEESTRHRLDLPMGFDRVVPYGTNDPAVFGTTQPADDAARSGSYAFRFELDGHSMAARTRAGMIPVRPGTDLEVSTWVRMRDVQHAGVRLVAWLTDADGHRVGSPVFSSCIEQASEWTRLDVVVEGRTLHATELVVELQTLQLGHRPDVQSTLPPPIDVHGQVHFDDVVIMQRPSIRLDDGRRHGLHAHGTTPTLHLHLFDPIPEPVQWTLVIEDEDGTVLARHAGSIPNGESTLRIDAPCPMRGWYRASLTATTPQGLQAKDVLDFVVLAPGEDSVGTTGTLHLTHWPTDDDLRLASTLGVGSISLPFVNADGQPASTDDALRTRLDAYLDRGGALEFHLETLPSVWCSELALDCRQLNDFTELGADRWKPLLDAVAVQWGPAAARWRLGGDADARTTGQWQAHLSTLVPDAMVTASDERENDFMQSLQASMLRITPPWSADDRGRMRPNRDFIAHHTLLQALRNRQCTGMIRIAPDTEGWVLQGTERSDALLVHRPDGGLDTNSLALDDAAYRVDMNGNAWQLDTQDDTKTWTAADTPFLIEAEDDQLLRLQRDLQLQPATLPARPRRHAHRVQVSNPTSTSMRGTLRFADAGRIHVDPPLLHIELAPHERRLLDVELLVTGPLPLGPHAIEAMLHLQQPGGGRIPVRCWTDVGLPELEVDVTSTPTVHGPLDVTIQIRNLGATTRHLDARLVGDGTGTLPDQRISVAPGETSGHRFLVHIDPTADPGQAIRAQIAEVETSGCIQVAITLPETTELATVDPLAP